MSMEKDKRILREKLPEQVPLWNEPAIPLMKYHSRRERRVKEPLPITILTGVNYPSLTPYLVASAKKSVPAVVICPGGAYEVLAFDYEGYEVAEWLSRRGVAAFVLKYRVPKQKEAALCDAQRALRYVRANARKFGVNPKMIGIMGFSAGGHLSASLATRYGERTYPKGDAIDTFSCRPDFCGLIYPAYLEEPMLSPAKEAMDETAKGGFKVASDLKVNAKTPPTFLLQAQDDPYVPSLPCYLLALMKNHVPLECHIYPKGGHGFGTRPCGAPVDGWLDVFLNWINGLTAKKPAAKR